MVARWLTIILPAMSLAEALDTTRIHRIAGLTGDRTARVTTRPCRAPHHTSSDVGRIGGGQDANLPVKVNDGRNDWSLCVFGLIKANVRVRARRQPPSAGAMG